MAQFWLDPVRLHSSGGFSRNEINKLHRLVGQNQDSLPRAWNESLVPAIRRALAEKVSVTDDSLIVDVDDGRTVSFPLAWFPRLLHGTAEELNNWRFIGKGEGIHWPDLDEDISIEGILFGRPSGESQRSFRRWLVNRSARNHSATG